MTTDDGTETSPSTDMQAKEALRRGTMATLNIYTSDLAGGLLGYAYYPQEITSIGTCRAFL